MWYRIGWALVMLAAVYGVMDLLCRLICRRWFSAFHGGYFVVPLTDDACTEYAVRHAKLLGRFLPRGDVRVVVVDNGEATEMTWQLCQRLQVELVTVEEWKKIQETTLQPTKKGV